MLNSDYRALCAVDLPFRGRQMYMHTFDLANPVMAAAYEDYLEPVAKLCQAAKASEGLAHMTVDERLVPAGQSQRRPGPHVDVCFMAAKMSWGHDPQPGWRHYCNNTGTKIGRMSVIVAASERGCRAWRGDFQGEPKYNGDLSHIAEQLSRSELLLANLGYLFSPDCVHESVVFSTPTQRTFLRIALPLEFRY